MDLSTLREMEGRTVRVAFDDGEEAIVRLATVDPEHDDILYEIVEILKSGPASDRPRDAFYVQPISSVVSAEPISHDPSH